MKADPAVVRQRVRNRSGHFFKENLLDSQYATLEEPSDALIIDAGDEPERLVQRISDALGLGLIPGSNAKQCAHPAPGGWWKRAAAR